MNSSSAWASFILSTSGTAQCRNLSYCQAAASALAGLAVVLQVSPAVLIFCSFSMVSMRFGAPSHQTCSVLASAASDLPYLSSTSSYSGGGDSSLVAFEALSALGTQSLFTFSGKVLGS